jgi:hypothetical protein
MASTGRIMPLNNEEISVVRLNGPTAKEFGLVRIGIVTDDGKAVMGWRYDDAAAAKLEAAGLVPEVHTGRQSHFATCPQASRFRRG